MPVGIAIRAKACTARCKVDFGDWMALGIDND